MNKFILPMVVAILLVGGAIFLVSGGQKETKKETKPNVTVVDGTQIIEIKAKGGYLPRRSVATAGLPTILRVNTIGTFDCSAVISIPSLKINATLPPSGTTDFDLGAPPVGLLSGSCGMGMFPFEIGFEDKD
jgi:plastocyanin domain-containing protein